MQGLTMDYQLTLPALLKRAEDLFGPKEIVTRLPDKSLHRYTYADFVRRSKKLGIALRALGLEKSDRVATLAWNQYQHLEAYFGVPSAELVLHTINPRLSPQEIAYIINHAEDKVLFIDETLVRLVDAIKDDVDLEHIYVYTSGEAPEGFTSYEDFIRDADEAEFVYPDLDEDDAAALCYTSGTTGRPKGALYSHRCLCIHSLIVAMPDAFNFREADTVLPVVPMFHVNAWGIPVTATMVGCKQVMPGPHLDPESLLELFQDEEVTFTAGVPTIWLGILQTLDADPDRYDLSKLERMGVGGSAAPEGMIRAYEKRHGLKILHAWGMTEMSPVGTASYVTSELRKEPEDVQFKYRAKQGIQLPFVEIRARGDEGFIPWDGRTMGELEVRGPTVARAYFNTDEGSDKFTDDGWFRTGDVVSITPGGYVEIRDRDKDLVKSGGEWISSVDLENTLMGHDAVAEAAVIAVPHEKWDERPLAVVVLKEGRSATPEELREYLSKDFASWQLPDAFEFVDSIPRTATGKFLKMALREQFKDYQLTK
ncbi:Acyl-CoA synthetases (AMP-forming)/AMP-acid ligases II [Rubrobacter radiotolerans]|uniref:Acyl-CoA synthetases (AMP-forming)/AMP-acid ligases II n=1 Tax=Rubrobacter radiotolerans TaxID=42256 RepID=A0A023X5Q4_RUBRA|nr:long-chain fatty acid--CoA ligase [Rubrobacter radiotolerans]AHY47335.1 Acyl-CoA synthetases (AMP-forming)/AMP-acid ligases II [Rubrobacter radiotolerans]MDX5894739.1 long-chain fatty acid--CoA ligase [Rubrobacter radiotolerans]SMC06647.1 fatty-acyl-CoA synthase [Rubrobacter radiotolerans DSM 5868]